MGAGFIPVTTDAGGGGVLAEWSLKYFGAPADPVLVSGVGGSVVLAEPEIADDPLTTGYFFHSSGTGITLSGGLLLLTSGLWTVSFSGVATGFTFFGINLNLDDDNLGGASEQYDALPSGTVSWTGRVADNCGVVAGYSTHGELTPQPVERFSLSVVKLAD